MDETKSSEFQRSRMAQILHTTARQLGEDEMYRRLNEKYLPSTQHEDHPDYAGPPNPELDRDIEEWEVRQATQDLKLLARLLESVVGSAHCSPQYPSISLRSH